METDMKKAILALALLTGACAGRTASDLAFNDATAPRIAHRQTKSGPAFTGTDLVIALQPGVPFNGCMVTAETQYGQPLSNTAYDCDTSVALQFDRTNRRVAALRR
jgi:hypothetical protein